MKHKRVRRMIREFLSANQPASFHAIKSHIEENTKYGVTSNTLANLLGKDPDIDRCNYMEPMRSNCGGVRYQMSVWRLRSWYQKGGEPLE